MTPRKSTKTVVTSTELVAEQPPLSTVGYVEDADGATAPWDSTPDEQEETRWNVEEEASDAEKAALAPKAMPLSKPTHKIILNDVEIARGGYPEMVAALKITPHATMMRVDAPVKVRPHVNLKASEELVNAIATLREAGKLSRTKSGWKAAQGYMLSRDDVNVIVKHAAKVVAANQPVAPLLVAADGLSTAGAWALKIQGVLVGYANDYESACAYAKVNGASLSRSQSGQMSTEMAVLLFILMLAVGAAVCMLPLGNLFNNMLAVLSVM